ncbi:MAG: sigma-54 dependent transcriptional regulator [Deltaproteobacteria bacterium]|nr:sigma-54 dependent transcriptional regulator [Deltaproteobacteria bacterium]
MSAILVGSDRQPFDVIQQSVGSEHHVEGAQTLPELLDKVGRLRPDYVFMDLSMVRDLESGPNGGGLDTVWRRSPMSEIIVMSPPDKIRETVGAVKAGAADYVTHPLDPAEIKFVLHHIREHIGMEAELDYLRDKFWEDRSLEVIQTKCPEMKAVYGMIRAVAPTRSTVLLAGETGTGKGLLAQLIHSHSNRKDAPFISVHCGAIPDTLVESELFGHEKGAFTGATKRKLGRFEVAHTGTIFLDEVGTLTPAAQIKLLQVLQDGTISRVGGERTVRVDVRVISATNVDLEQMTQEGRFRKDLFYRLNVFPITIPPLRKRSEDISHLAHLFLKRLERQGHKDIRSIEPDALEGLKGYSWPGNIREMENVMERAYILGSPPVLVSRDFPTEVLACNAEPHHDPKAPLQPLAQVRRRAAEAAEKRHLRHILAECRGRIKDTAQVAGVTPRQLHKLMTKYGLHKEEFRRSRNGP